MGLSPISIMKSVRQGIFTMTNTMMITMVKKKRALVVKELLSILRNLIKNL